MNQIKTVEDYRNIPANNPNKAKVGLSLPTEEFKKLSVEEKSVIFAEALAARPIEEQIAASTIAKNVLNGCCWEFVRSSPEIKKNLENFKNSKVCSVQRVTYNKKQGIYGYLVYMQMSPLCALFDESNRGPIDANDLKRACQHREEAKMGLIKKLQKGYQGRIGIFCTNDSQSITIDGKSYPAFAVTLKELCAICTKLGYGMKMGGAMRTPNDVLAREDKVIENLTVAPSSNALFIEIAKM